MLSSSHLRKKKTQRQQKQQQRHKTQNSVSFSFPPCSHKKLSALYITGPILKNVINGRNKRIIKENDSNQHGNNMYNGRDSAKRRKTERKKKEEKQSLPPTGWLPRKMKTENETQS